MPTGSLIPVLATLFLALSLSSYVVSAADSQQEPDVHDPSPRFAAYMTQGADPQTYVDRYEDEDAYRRWFDTYFVGMSIQQAVGLAAPEIPMTDPDPRFAAYMTQGDDPQFYVDRYESDQAYRQWFDTYFAWMSIHQAVGLDAPQKTATESQTTNVPDDGMDRGIMEEGMMMTTSDGEVMVHVMAMSNPTAGEPLDIMLQFTDSEGNMVEHVNYDVLVTQGNTRVASESGSHNHEGMSSLKTRALSSDSGVDVNVTLQGIGLPGTSLAERSGPVGEMVEFTEVPESDDTTTPVSEEPDQEPQQTTNVPDSDTTTPVSEELITVSTDKESYSAGETVTVTGQVRQSLQGAVGMVVNAPNGDRVIVDQLELESDGTFTTTFVAGGPQWQYSGSYEILVIYSMTQSNNVTNTATIEFTGGSITPVPMPTPTDPDPLTGITSSITGGSIRGISPGSDGISIIVIIDATDDGELTLNIPRAIFETKEDGQLGDDIPFSILIDGGLADATETTMADLRTLVIPFTVGTETIEVVGSWIIA